MEDSGIDVITQTPQVIVKAEDEARIGTESISFSIYRLPCGLKELGAGQLKRLRPKYGHVNSPDPSQPTVEPNDQAGTQPQGISRISNNLPDEKSKYYVPHMFRLGPFHHPPQFQHDESEKIKSKFLDTCYGDCHFKKLVNDMIHDRVTQRIRGWYVQYHRSNEDLLLKMNRYSDEDLGRMMARDGLFLLQFLRSFSEFPQPNTFHAARVLREILTSPVCNANGCFRPSDQQFAVQEDVMKIDNQIPFFVLQKMLQWDAHRYQCNPDKDEGILIHQRQADTDDLVTILKRAWFILSPIQYKYDSQDSHVTAGVPLKENSHLLEFVYENMVSSSDLKDLCKPGKKNRNKPRKNKRGVITLPRAVELKEKGVKFAPNTGLLNKIRFDGRNRTLYLPAIEMDGRTDAVLRNLVRFEGSKKEKESQPLISYVNLMERLIDKADDVQALRNGGVIHSHLGTNDDVANVWNGMRGELPAEIRYGPIDNAIDEVISFYTSKYRIMYTEFKRRYCSKPWIVISVISACILLGLSIIQTLLAWEQVRVGWEQVHLQLESMNKT